MMEQFLLNVSTTSLPVIIGASIIGSLLMVIMLGFILRHLTKPDVGNSRQASPHQDNLIDLLQGERHARDQDFADGVITADEHASATLEIDRRLLAISLEMDKAKPSKSGPAIVGIKKNPVLRPLPIIASALIPAAALLIYLFIGSPQTIDRPFASRTAEIAAAKSTAQATITAGATALRAAIAATERAPESIEAWLLLARAAAGVGDLETEIQALQTAIDLTKGDPSIMSMLAEAYSRAADGQVTVPARALVKTVLARNPLEPRALFLSGLAAFQDGEHAEAIGYWQKLLSISRPDAPWISRVNENIRQAAEAGNIRVNNDENSAGPDAEAIADAASMSDEDRAAMINSMVNRLKDRLASTPGDIDGWLRLARAYEVLDRPEAALNALENVGKIAPEHPQMLFIKGKIARNIGNIAAARIAWQKLLATLPEGSEAATALASEIQALKE